MGSKEDWNGCKWNPSCEELLGFLDLEQDSVKVPDSGSYDYVLYPNAGEYAGAIGRFLDAGLSRERMAGYEYYVRKLRGIGQFYAPSNVMLAMEICRRLGVDSVLDRDLMLCRGEMYTRQNVYLDPVSFFPDGYADEREYPSICCNIYRKIWQKKEDIRLRHWSLCVFFRERSAEEYLRILENPEGLPEYLMFFCLEGSETFQELRQDGLVRFGEVEWIPATHGSWLVVERRKPRDIAFYVVAHQQCKLPELPEGYRILHAGRALSDDLGYIGDDTGENISEWNPVLNELTASYWIWKNTEHGAFGFCHYRRFFLRDTESEDLLDAETAAELLEEYDVLLTAEWMYPGWTNDDQITQDVGSSTLCRRTRELLRGKLEKYHPEDLEAFDAVAFGQGLYRCNMMVARKPVWDAYCEWLFPFLMDSAVEVATWGLTGRPARVLGFWAERMLMAWLSRQTLRIRELPMLQLE